MFISRRTLAEVIVGVIVVGALLLRSWQLDRALERNGRLALTADTLEAVRDTSRRVLIAAAVLDTDRIATQRRAVQVEQRADSLDRALHLSRMAKAELTARVDSLRVQLSSVAPVVEDPAGERAASFVIDSAPFHVRADVYMPKPPEAARLTLAVTLDTLPLEVRLGCAGANAAGIRSASVTVIGPRWANLSLGRVEQDPGVCRSPALEPAHGDGRSTFRKFVDRLGLSVGIDVHGKPNALAGFRVWP